MTSPETVSEAEVEAALEAYYDELCRLPTSLLRKSEDLKRVCLRAAITAAAQMRAQAVDDLPKKPTPAILEAIKQAIWKNTWGEAALVGHWAAIRSAALGIRKGE